MGLFEAFEAALREEGLGAHVDYARSVMRPGILLHAGEAGASIPVGASKLGGEPDLGAGARWPEHDQGPYEFIAQLDLAALPPSTLPASGLLSLFAATRPEEALFHGDEGYVRAIYTPASTPLVRRALPPHSEAQAAQLEEEAAYGAEFGEAMPKPGEVSLPLSFTPFLDFPRAPEQRKDWPLDEADRLIDVYCEVLEGLHETEGDQLLGYPGQRSLAYDPRGGRGWESLLCLNSHEALGWAWHDGDLLYVSIEASRLAASDFSALRSDAG